MMMNLNQWIAFFLKIFPRTPIENGMDKISFSSKSLTYTFLIPKRQKWALCIPNFINRSSPIQDFNKDN